MPCVPIGLEELELREERKRPVEPAEAETAVWALEERR